VSAAALIIVALLLAGPPSVTNARDRVVTAEAGLIQSTVSGAGTLQPAGEIGLDFPSGGKLATAVFDDETRQRSR